MARNPKPTPSKPAHGGARPGARRPKGEPSKVIRLPARLLPAVQALADSDNLPTPEVITAEIVEDLEVALEQFREILADMDGTGREMQGA